MKRYQNFIDGKWCDPLTDEWIDNTNPANGKLIGLFPGSGEEDVQSAASSARDSLKRWKQVPAPKRAEILFKAVEYLAENRDGFALDLCNEMGKIMDECRGDIQETIDMALFCAGEGRRNLGMVTSSEFEKRTVFALRCPIGVVGAITPWNFPMAMPAWKVMPALITGNTVILKPAEDTPHSAVNLARAFEYAGLPKGVLNLVMGLGEKAGHSLVMQDGVDLTSFTGSTEVGTAIAEQCPAQFKRVSLEMGGKNVVIVLSDADIDLAVNGIVRSVFATCGQRCASAGRIIAEEPIIKTLTDKLLERANKLKLGSGLDKDTDIGPIINEERLQSIDEDVSGALKEGAKLLCGGERETKNGLDKGCFYKPTLLTSVTPDMSIAQKETFGPVASIMPAKDLSHALETANDIKYGLTAAIFTKDINKAMQFVHDIEAGAVFVNTACVGAEIQLPFGGMKGSGNGRREGAHHMLDIYSEWKSVSIQQD